MGICSKPTEVFSRIVGYYRPVHQWNDGKLEEFNERVTFDENIAVNKEFEKEEKKDCGSCA